MQAMLALRSPAINTVVIIKGIVHPNIKALSLFTHPHSYDFFFRRTQKKKLGRMFKLLFSIQLCKVPVSEDFKTLKIHHTGHMDYFYGAFLCLTPPNQH